MSKLPHATCPTESQEERRSLFPFAVPLCRLRLAAAWQILSLGTALALLGLAVPDASAQPFTERNSAQDFNTFWGPTSTWADGGQGPQVSLEEGGNSIIVEVTARNGFSRLRYFVEVNKLDAPPVSGGPLPLSFQPSSLADKSSATAWKSRLMAVDSLPNGGIRFVFLVPAGEFQIEETVDLLGGNWRPLAKEAFQSTRESIGQGQDRLTVILPKAEGKHRFLRLAPALPSEEALEQEKILPEEAILFPFLACFVCLRRQNRGMQTNFFWIGFISFGTLLSVVTVPSSMAQPLSETPEWITPPPNVSPSTWAPRNREALFNIPGSVLHGRTARLAEAVLGSINDENRRAAEQAGNPIPERLTYNQITNLIQLASIKTITGFPYSEDVHPGNYYLFHAENLRAGDLAGLVNLKILGFEQLKTIEAGVFDGLPNLEILHLHLSRSGSGGPLPAGLFDPLANSLKDLRVGPGGIASGTNYFSLSTNALDRLTNLEKLGINIAYAGGYDHLVNLKEVDFSFHFDSRSQYGDAFAAFYGAPRSVITLPPSVRILGVGSPYARYKIQEPVLPPPVNVNVGGYVFPVLSPSPQPTAEVGQRSSDLRFTSTSLSLAEGESATYQVRATSSQAREMVVNLTTAHSGITVNPNRLTFYSHNWQTFQTVTLTASADAADTNEQASIQHSIPASPGFIANNNAGSVSITLAHTIVEEEEEEEEPERQAVQQDPMPPTDYDQDDDGLIDIRNLAQLNAIRWDLNGDGQPDKEEFANDYALAFPSAVANMGVPHNIQAQGYELTNNLNLDANEDETLDEADPFWNKGTGWQSIGLFSQPFQAVLEGNGHVIYNLFQDQSDAALFANTPSGLFGSIGNRGQVVNLGLENVNIQGVNWVGALAGLNQGIVETCSATGRVEGVNGVGGLVGQNFGDIVLSAVDVEVNGVSGVGDLVGIDTAAR